MIIAVPKETRSGEHRVALVPDGAKALVKAGHEVRIEAGAGFEAGYLDASYTDAGARIVADASAAVSGAQLVLKIQAPTDAEAAGLASGTIVVALLRPLDEPEAIQGLAAKGIDAFSLELVPRITRAQSMDVLSSQATVAGYRAVLLAADRLPKMFPMMVTAAGTLSPAKVFVIGAGVAGLQAIATAKRLGAVVEAYDTRAAAAEQVESLGGKFVELTLETGDSEDSGGYAKAQTEEFYDAQRKLMGEVAGRSDVVVTTALVPGREAPLLLDEDGVKAMAPGTVVVDLAAPNGGNCACTTPGETVTVHDVHVMGPLNLPSELPLHASQMFSKNLVTFVNHLAPEGELVVDLEDEITVGSLVSRGGQVVHPVVQEKLGIAPAAAPEGEA